VPLAIFDDAYACGEAVNLDRDGAEYYVVVVKQTFTWDERGLVRPIAPQPVVNVDVYDGDPATSSVVLEAEVAPRKPRVDVLLAGEIVYARQCDRAVMQLEVGAQIEKWARIFGDRTWAPGFLGPKPTDPRPFDRMPITWSRSFGGVDPKSPAHVDRRNPGGRGFARTEMNALGLPLPNFEAPDDLIGAWNRHPRPVGFGPVARSCPSRLRWAGTYDKAWLEERFPLLPLDFDDRFYNCAPDDQQLDAYRPGECVRLRGMVPGEGDTSFALPACEVPVTVLEHDNRTTEGIAKPDTILIEPGERRFSVVGRFLHFPRPDVLAIDEVLVGTPWKGWLRARKAQKRYFGRDPRRPR
jgi:hypothetical protein